MAHVDVESTELTAEPAGWSFSGPLLWLKSAIVDRDRQYADSLTRRRRVVAIVACTASVVSASFAVIEVLATSQWYVVSLNAVMAVVFAVIPLLYRLGELVSALALVIAANVSLVVVSWMIDSHVGIAFYFLMSVLVAALVLGIDHLMLAAAVVTFGVVINIAARVVAPFHARKMPVWATDAGFAVTTISASVVVMATIWYALNEIERAKEAIELEYERAESLLTNILPASVAARLKDPATKIIADNYDDVSILFADIAGYTERASRATAEELVKFLNRFYGECDDLVERHGLEKVKTSGDCYIVVSGVPQPKSDHLEALARFALSLSDSVGHLTDHTGETVSIRIGLAAGPVVAGVVGTSRFFYDVWGDPVNVAARMESTGFPGRIQVPQDVYERLRERFVFEERGTVAVKGKGMLHTWFLVGERTSESSPVGGSVVAAGD